MAFSILNSPVDYYSGENFNLWSFSTGWVAGNSPAQQQHIYTLNTTGIGSLILVPDVGVSCHRSMYFAFPTTAEIG